MNNNYYEFKAYVVNASGHGITSSTIIIPNQILEKINSKGRIRVKGKINGIANFNLAIQPIKTGEKYFSISADLRRRAKIKVGDNVLVTFEIADPNELELPEELMIAMEQDELGKSIFCALTIGYQRSLVHYVNSAKNIDVRINRALKLMEKAKNGDFKK